jgi:hypothetical protein
MDAATVTPISAAELIERLPTADDIRARLEQLDAERRSLMPLLRAAIARERGRERVAAAKNGGAP